MVSRFHDIPGFVGESIINYHALSNIGSVIGNNKLDWSGWSIAGSHVTNRSINPAETSATAVAQVLATLVMDLMQQRKQT
jgi:hypothetical protein